MLLAKLTIQYERGIEHNQPKDLGLDNKPRQLPDGRIVRGIGTHFRNEAEMQLVKERDRENARVRDAFRQQFLCTSIDGLYIIPRRGAAEAFLSGLQIRDDVRVRVQEFWVAVAGELDQAELADWATKIKRQLESVSLGRTKECDDEGLRALETLATCPVLKKETGNRIREIVASVRESKATRIEVRRALSEVEIEIETEALAPRSVSVQRPSAVEA